MLNKNTALIQTCKNCYLVIIIIITTINRFE